MSFYFNLFFNFENRPHKLLLALKSFSNNNTSNSGAERELSSSRVFKALRAVIFSEADV